MVSVGSMTPYPDVEQAIFDAFSSALDMVEQLLKSPRFGRTVLLENVLDEYYNVRIGHCGQRGRLSEIRQSGSALTCAKATETGWQSTMITGEGCCPW